MWKSNTCPKRKAHKLSHHAHLLACVSHFSWVHTQLQYLTFVNSPSLPKKQPPALPCPIPVEAGPRPRESSPHPAPTSQQLPLQGEEEEEEEEEEEGEEGEEEEEEEEEGEEEEEEEEGGHPGPLSPRAARSPALGCRLIVVV